MMECSKYVGWLQAEVFGEVGGAWAGGVLTMICGTSTLADDVPVTTVHCAGVEGEGASGKL